MRLELLDDLARNAERGTFAFLAGAVIEIDPAAFDRIYKANRDRLTSPEDLRSGQVLRLPRP